MPVTWFSQYLSELQRIADAAQATKRGGEAVGINVALEGMWEGVELAHTRGNHTMFIGNGGSAGICSHSAIDYCKNGGVRSVAFNDGAALTCLGNDYGFDQIFSRQIEFHGREGDVLIAISSSGRSDDILKGCEVARNMGCTIFTLSGFDADNPLRGLGDVNMYLDSHDYGFVELGHQTLIHAALDRGKGWGKS